MNNKKGQWIPVGNGWSVDISPLIFLTLLGFIIYISVKSAIGG